MADPRPSSEFEPVFLSRLDACRERMQRSHIRTSARLDSARQRAQRRYADTQAHVEKSQRRIAESRSVLERLTRDPAAGGGE